MFDYVKRSEYEIAKAEVVRLKSVNAALTLRVADQKETIDGLREDLRQARLASQQTTRDLLEHLAPLEKEVGAGPFEPFSKLSPEQIRAMPAHGKREMAQREMAAKAREREIAAEQDENFEQRRDTLLSDAERAELEGELDPMLGIRQVPKPAAEAAETATQ